MPTKNEIKFIKSLKQNKNRQVHGLFVAEGDKLVAHFLKLGLTHKGVYSVHAQAFGGQAEMVSVAEMKSMSLLQNPSPSLGLFNFPLFNKTKLSAQFTLVLDGIRDPGNMGTILRLCDWFGVTQVVCTPDCVDVFNEKVVQASMGSVATVQAICYTREELVTELKNAGYALVGTKMEAPSVYKTTFSPKTALVLGNEGQGVSAVIEQACHSNVSIPAAPTAMAESLNVATAAAIFLSEFARLRS